MTANQNMNETSMKHVQQHSLFKTASKVTEMFPKTLLWLQIGDIIDSHISWPWTETLLCFENCSSSSCLLSS